MSTSIVRRAGLFGLLAALFSSFGQTFFIGLFGGEFREAFGLGSATLGVFYGVATIASGVLMFWLGDMADRLDPARAILVSLGLLALGCILVALAPTAWILLPGLFLLRLGGQGLTGHLAMVVAARYTLRNRGRSVAMASYGFILGEAVLPLAVAGLLGVLDWRTVWLMAAAVLILAAMPGLGGLAAMLAGRQPEIPGASAETTPAAMGRAQLLRHPSFVLALPVVLVSPFVVTAVFLHQGGIAELRGWSLQSVASAFMLFAVVQAIAAFAAGRIVDLFGSLALMRVYLLPMGVGLVALGFLPGGPALWILFAGFGMTAGGNGVVAGALWAELFGVRQLGMIRGVYAAFMVASTAASPPVLGLALEAGVSLAVIGGIGAAWCLLVPQLLVPRIGRRRPQA